jgi:ABC-type multidrug transport system fused ATPase/permease subunit
VLLIALAGLSWSGLLEQSAEQSLKPTFQRALFAAAIARGLNGIISVAQGTEIAIQPVGVGVTITAGEILDPLNDLVERFSWLALAASASLGAQMLLSEIFAEPLVNAALTLTVIVYLLILWWPRPLPSLGWMLRLAGLIVFLRFLFSVVTLTVGWIDHWVLAERQQEAITQLSDTTRELEELEDAEISPDATERSVLERFESALDSSRQALDVESQLEALSSRVEDSISQLIDLIVLFVVQTLMLPLGAFYLALASFRWFWRWSLNAS